ncbi:hypothetical protein HNQ50_001595 [Silvimonas terrae]|uniref:DUF2092 domain-containing protein n=1 Tax=Silvimonas terrae TaxID=300266 RepID=A0A840REY9_9NEIS|nr:DUF2092 domain-containing protein [Silvimonas terrae]MBB5190872.1 hypothetical protein [Silvimonas terrae]
MTLRVKLTGLLLILVTLQAWAEDAPAADASAPAAVVNPRVIDKLTQMGNYLRSLPKFEVAAVITHDTVLDTGQKLQMQATTRLLVEGHTKLYASLDSDTQSRQFFFNGSKLTQYSPDLKYYTTVNVQGTIATALHDLEDHYNLQIPMEDLFLFGTDKSQADALTSALYVGPSHINGKLCDHLAFRQEGADWQLWITRSDKPLPCKLVITTTDDDTRPEYSAVYTWNLQPAIKGNAFTFAPGKKDVAIPLTKASDND